MLASLLLLGLVFADSINCKARSGPKLTYFEWHSSGGASPSPGALMGEVGWRLGEAVLYRSEERYTDEAPMPTGDDPETMDPAVNGDLDWAWDEASQKTRRSEGSSVSGSTTYTAKVAVWTRSGQPIHADLPEPRVTVKMVCTRAWEDDIP